MNNLGYKEIKNIETPFFLFEKQPLIHEINYEFIHQPKPNSNSISNKNQQLVRFTCLENDRFFSSNSFFRFNRRRLCTI